MEDKFPEYRVAQKFGNKFRASIGTLFCDQIQFGLDRWKDLFFLFQNIYSCISLAQNDHHWHQFVSHDSFTNGCQNLIWFSIDLNIHFSQHMPHAMSLAQIAPVWRPIFVVFLRAYVYGLCRLFQRAEG